MLFTLCFPLVYSTAIHLYKDTMKYPLQFSLCNQHSLCLPHLYCNRSRQRFYNYVVNYVCDLGSLQYFTTPVNYFEIDNGLCK